MTKNNEAPLTIADVVTMFDAAKTELRAEFAAMLQAPAKPPTLKPLTSDPATMRFVAGLAMLPDRRSQITTELRDANLFALPSHFEPEIAARLGAQLMRFDLGVTLPVNEWTPLLAR